jgi:hypothetical protein
VAAFNAGQLTAVDAAKAKLVTSELQVKAADIGVQLHGGAGYMDEYPISRQFTDAKIHHLRRQLRGDEDHHQPRLSRQADYQPFNTRNF